MLVFYLSLLETEQEKETFTELYEKHKTTCLHTAMAITKNQQMAEDAVHNAFMTIIEKKESIFSIPCGKRKSRIVIIVKNKAIDLMKNESKATPYGDEIDDFASDEADFTLKIESEESFERLINIIGQLPEIYRLTAELRFFHDMEYSAIAGELGITIKAVSMRLNRAKLMIQELIRKEGVPSAN